MYIARPVRLLVPVLALLSAACDPDASKTADSADPGSSGSSTTSDGLVVSPSSLDFGVVAVGASKSEVVTLSNPSDATLSIEAPVLSTGTLFSVSSDVDLTALELPPGDSVELVLTYTADDDLPDNDVLQVVSSDGPHSVSLVGTGSHVLPTAVIDCPVDPGVPVPVSLDGSHSDPGGGSAISTYTWTVLSVPDGSATTAVADPTSGTTSMFLDAVGTYAVGLQVENDIGGVSTVETCTFTAAPTSDLQVVLTWDAADSDLDLHLTKAGSPMYLLPSDCNFCNPTPEWGESGAHENPTLALDNRTGFGPEHITMSSPTEDEYDVWVYYFDDNGAGTVEANVQVWLAGSLAWEGAAEMSRREAWHAGTVSTVDGNFSENSDGPAAWTGATECYTE